MEGDCRVAGCPRCPGAGAFLGTAHLGFATKSTGYWYLYHRETCCESGEAVIKASEASVLFSDVSVGPFLAGASPE